MVEREAFQMETVHLEPNTNSLTDRETQTAEKGLWGRKESGLCSLQLHVMLAVLPEVRPVP